MLRDLLVWGSVLARGPIVTVVYLPVLAEFCEHLVHILLQHVALIEWILLELLILNGVKLLGL